MPLADYGAKLDQEEAELRGVIEAARLRLAGIAEERRRWRASMSVTTSTASPVSRVDAVVAILSASLEALSPTEILNGLRAAGRDDSINTVTATISYLERTGKVTRPARGKYLVP